MGFLLPTFGEEPGLEEQLPRITAKEPADALSTFQLLGGFTIQRAAAEPDVVDPVDAAFDENGRIWVVEMRGYPYPEATPMGRVRILSDNDDDGVFEHSQILAAEISWPTGIALWKGGCFVIAAPDILYLKDTDGDGQADVRDVVFTGFGRDNVQALANNLKWGIDNRFWGATAGNGGAIRRGTEPNAEPVAVRGRDFSFDPRRLDFRAESGTAQFGNAFNDDYDRFVCSNSDHAIQVVLDARYLERNPLAIYPPVLRSIAQEGGAGPVFRRSQPEPWRVVRTARRARTPDKFAATELVVTGFFTSASGVTVYRGDAYPEEMRGNLFVGDVGGNLIHRKRLDESGSTFVARRADEGAEFLTSTDNWFRPVNFVHGPDGCLYILDMYRETIEHPWSIPEDIKAHLDLESGRDRGRIYRLTPPSLSRRPATKLGAADVETLVGLLGHKNAWHRETAQRLLVERGESSAIPLLRKALRADADNPLGQRHILGTLDGLQAIEDNDLLVALRSEFPRVREFAVRVCEGRLTSSPALASVVLSLAKDPELRVRQQVAFSVGELPATTKSDALLTIVRQDPGNPYVRAAVLSSAADAAPELMAGQDPTKLDLSFTRELARIVAARDRKDELVRLSHSLRDLPWRGKVALLAGVVDGTPHDPAKLLGVLESRGLATEEWFQRISACGLNVEIRKKELPLQERLLLVRALRLQVPSSPLESYATLLRSNEPRELQAGVLRELSEMKEPRIAGLLVEAWSQATPSLRGEILEVLLGRPDRQRALLDAVETGAIPSAQLPVAARERLAGSRDRTIRERNNTLLASVTSNRKEVIQRYLEAVTLEGRPDSGRIVCERECATCHKVGEKGFHVGPSLDSVRSRTAEQLITHILDPNLEVLPNYVEYSVALDDGRVATGIIAAESTTSITLRRAEGVEQMIERDAIEEMKSSGRSLMPEGLEQKLTIQEMADLIAYLQGGADTERDGDSK